MASRTSTYVQGFVAAGLVLGLVALVRTAHENISRQNIATGFDILFRPTGWDLSFGLLPHSIRDPYWWTFLVGLSNTLAISAVCIVLALLAGVVIALLAASRNPLLTGFSSLYVTLIRNVPQIVQVFFWYHLTRQLPPIRQAIAIGDAAYLSNRGLQVPSLTLAHGGPLAGALAAIALAALLAFAVRARAPTALTGRRIVAFALLAAGIAAILMPPGAGIEIPVLRGFNFQGGMLLPPEFLALVAAITVYNAAFVAEIVRSGLNAVPQGQLEAARNLGLGEARIFWKITLPQAVRVIIPPLTNQVISITKSSSLAVAIGLTDLFSIGTIAINHTGQALEVIAILMAVYLTISLLLSAGGNWLNARVQPAEGRR